MLSLKQITQLTGGNCQKENSCFEEEAGLCCAVQNHNQCQLLFPSVIRMCKNASQSSDLKISTGW